MTIVANRQPTDGYTFSKPQLLRLWDRGSSVSLTIGGGRFNTHGYDVDTHNLYPMLHLEPTEHDEISDKLHLSCAATSPSGRLHRFVNTDLKHVVTSHRLSWAFTQDRIEGKPIVSFTTSAIQWIKDNTEGLWTIRLVGNGPSVSVQFMFEREHDAILCKLRW